MGIEGGKIDWNAEPRISLESEIVRLNARIAELESLYAEGFKLYQVKDDRIAELEADIHALLARGAVSVHGSDGCSSCETGRITIYAHSRVCMECQRKAENKPDRTKS